MFFPIPEIALEQSAGHWGDQDTARVLAVLGPLIFAADLILLLGGEVILDVEGLADLLRRLALDHVGNRLASHVKKGLDIEIIGSLRGLSVRGKTIAISKAATYEDDLEQHLLIDLHEFLVPFINIGCLLTGVGIVFGSSRRIGTVVSAPLNDFTEDGLVDVRNWNVFLKSGVSDVFHHILDQDRALSNVAGCTKSVQACEGRCFQMDVER